MNGLKITVRCGCPKQHIINFKTIIDIDGNIIIETEGCPDASYDEGWKDSQRKYENERSYSDRQENCEWLKPPF